MDPWPLSKVRLFTPESRHHTPLTLPFGRYSWIHRDVYIYNPCNYIIHRDIYIYNEIYQGFKSSQEVQRRHLSRASRASRRACHACHMCHPAFPSATELWVAALFYRYSDTRAATCAETHFEGLFSLFQAVVLVSVAIQGMKATWVATILLLCVLCLLSRESCNFKLLRR